MNSKELKVYNLPKEARLIYRMETKPYVFLAIILCIGLCLFLYNSILALLICSVMAYSIFLLPSKILVDFYDTYLVMYNRPGMVDCIMIYYDEIVSWTYRWGYREDELIIELVDGSIERVECFSKKKISKLLNLYAPYKEAKVKR